VLERLKSALAKSLYKIVSGLISLTLLGAAFSLGTKFGQTDAVMDYWKNDTRSKLKDERARLESERAEHRTTKKILADTQIFLTNSEAKITQLKQELVETREMHEILEQFGSDFWLYRSYNLKSEIGAFIDIGKCGRVPCYRLLLRDFKKVPEPEIIFDLSGPGTTITGGSMPLFLPLKKGCGAEFYSGMYRFLLVMEDDRFTSVRAGLSIKTIDRAEFQEGVWIKKLAVTS
jgi:hypothetical protein